MLKHVKSYRGMLIMLLVTSAYYRAVDWKAECALHSKMLTLFHARKRQSKSLLKPKC